MPETRLYFLHGNLQTPRVWDFACRALPWQSCAPDLWASLAASMGEWAKTFCQQASAYKGKRVLIGYSLGGRLAMQALIEKPDLWAGAILIAAHPGSQDSQLRQQWLDNDRYWANRFKQDDWKQLMADWEAQPLFSGIPNPQPPQEDHLDRDKVAKAFINYSKGRQADMLIALQAHVPAILYLTGEYDSAYCEHGSKLEASLPGLRHLVVADAGHRVAWEQPQAFLQLTTEFLTMLMQA